MNNLLQLLTKCTHGGDAVAAPNRDPQPYAHLSERILRMGGELRSIAIAPDSRFYLPTLRRDFIRQARPYLRAGMDISDGLFCDTNKLLDMNKYGINILKNISSDVGQSGEEYEMLIAFDPRNQSALERLANSMDLPLTIFGTIAHNSDRFPCQSHHFG